MQECQDQVIHDNGGINAVRASGLSYVVLCSKEREFHCQLLLSKIKPVSVLSSIHTRICKLKEIFI
jgi:hypothetical protein